MFAHLLAHHDLRLVIVAVVVCAAGAFTTFTVYAHLLARGSADRKVWLLLNGVCAGASIWATHFVAMLAHQTGIAKSYDPLLTALSFAVAVAVTTVGIAVTLRPGQLWIGAGGIIIGLGVAAMHFIGMEAVIVPATFQWDWMLVALSVALGIIFNTGAMVAHREQNGARALLCGAVLFTLGICALHFIAMAALTIVANPGTPAPASKMDDPILALAIACVALTALLASCVVALMDARAGRVSAARTSALVDAAIEGLVIVDNGVIVNINGPALKLCGCKRGELIGKKVFGDLLAAAWRLPPFRGHHRFEAPLRRADGTTIPVEVVWRRLGLPGGDEVYAIRDLRERQETARQLAEANEDLRQHQQDLRARNFTLDAALANMSQGLCMYDRDQRVVISNERFATMYGLPADAIQPGMHLRDIVQQRIDNGIYAGASPEDYLAERTAPVLGAQDRIHELSDGRIIAVSRRPMPEGGWVTTHDDITEQRHMKEQITHLAHHDALTSLPRRTVLRERLEESLKQAVRQDYRLAVLILGIDRFSEINGALGHAAGDSLLKSVAGRLQNSARRSTILGRFTEDTFAIVEIVDHPQKDATGLADRLLGEMHKPFTLGDTSVDITATIGIAVTPTGGRDADTLLKNAALALNQGRIERRGSHHFFEAGMDQALKSRRTLEQELVEAVEKQQFVLHYQPVVNLSRNAVAGFEALLRWQHPTRGLLSPGSFLPLAEQAGLLPKIGEWTLQRACGDASGWPKDLIVSVNLAVSQFWSADFVPSIIKSLASSGLTADRLEIEVTEKVIHDNAEKALMILRRLSDLGVLIALDDFGAGFASLTYVRQFPFHKIKIDRSFVAGLSRQDESQMIIRTLARLGTGLGMITTAEGVETKEQLEIVRAEGCTEMQGYYFCTPKTAEEIHSLFLTTSSNVTKSVA